MCQSSADDVEKTLFLYSVDRGIIGGWLHFIVIGQELERSSGRGCLCLNAGQ